MKRLASIAAFLLLLCFNSFAEEKVKVIDGDTIHIGKLKYRFSGIDAPEMKQLCNKNFPVILSPIHLNICIGGIKLIML